MAVSRAFLAGFSAFALLCLVLGFFVVRFAVRLGRRR
jgi:hypothetical protein